MFVFTRFHHVVVAVNDLEAAAGSWEQVLGKPTGLTREPPWPVSWKSARFAVGDGWIELAEPTTADSPLRKHLDTYGQGVYSVGVQVDDITAITARAKAAGVTVLGDESKSGEAFVDAASINGVVLSLHDDDVRATGPAVFKRFHHIVVATKDQDAAVDHWKKVFGLVVHKEAPRGSVAPHHLPAGEGWFGLTSTGTSASALQKFLDRRGEGVYLVCVAVDDPNTTMKAVRERGGRTIGDEETDPQVFVHPSTTQGLLLEVRNDSERTLPEEA